MRAGIAPAGCGFLAVACLIVAACGDLEPERPVWGLSSSAIVAMDLDGASVEDYEALVAPPEAGCRQLLSMRVERSLPSQPAAEEVHELLAGAEHLVTSCRGSCGGEICKTQHMAAMRDRLQTARTRCICQPRDQPPCTFVIEWEIGEPERRRIRELACVAGEGYPGTCGFRMASDGRELLLACASD